MPVFNEEEYLQKAIYSVLNQSYPSFKLLISDNFSTDRSSVIIDEAARQDSRIRVFSPPRHMSGGEHGDYMLTQVLPSEPSAKYTILIGGHDIWDQNLLKVLFDRAEAEADSAVVYTDSWCIDKADNILHRYQGIFQTKEVAKPLIPLQVLLSLSHNVIVFGLWRESIRKIIKVRHYCSSCDHLLIAEYALHGSILYQPGSAVYLREVKDAGDWSAYAKKHIPDNIRQYPILDFLNQLEWCDSLVEKAVVGSFYAQEPLKNMLKNSLFSAYILRYWQTLNGIEGGKEAFFSHPKVKNYLNNCSTSTTILSQLIDSRIQDFPV